MSRPPRLILPAVPLHIIQRGNNRGACFAGTTDYLVYLTLLRKYAAEKGLTGSEALESGMQEKEREFGNLDRRSTRGLTVALS